MDNRISDILEIWFLNEPALYGVLCSHEIAENAGMECPLRCGRLRVEYNPEYIREMSDQTLEEALKTEAIRILLKHPYERRPDQCSAEAIALGSNVVIGDQYRYGSFHIEKPEDFSLEGGQAFEWYSRRIQELLSEFPDGDGYSGGVAASTSGMQGNGNPSGDEFTEAQQEAFSHIDRNRDLSALWEEDEMAVAKINGIIESTTRWGSLGGSLAEHLKASTKARINWRTVFAGFRASVLSSKRKLTRMRPNRRTGFEQMGSIRRFDTRLLIAVDVSGSISSEALSYFYGVINSAFRYGFESIDVIQFDCGITKVQSLKKQMSEVTALGRGGTSFQEPIDYAHENGYDGLVILTDGYAPAPTLPEGMHTKLIWVCPNRLCFEDNHTWMEKLGRACMMEIH